MRPLPSPPAVLFLVLLLSLSGCLGAERTDAANADSGESPASAEDPGIPEGATRLPNGTGHLLVRHFEGVSEYGETMVVGYTTSLGRGVHVVDVQVPANATTLQFELLHGATLDADPYVLAPRHPCGGVEDGDRQLAPLTGYVRDEPGLYVDRSDGAHAVVRLDEEVLERHGCGQPCPDVDEPTYDRSCGTWQLGFRVDPASAPFAWEAAVTLAIDARLDDGHRELS